LPLFHYSLNPGGILFLGSSETVGGFTDLFEPIDKKWKIYRRRDFRSDDRPMVQFPVTPMVNAPRIAHEVKPAQLKIRQLAEKALLESYVPPGVIIGSAGDILYIHGRTGKYLEPAPGEAKWNIHDMAREGLKPELARAVRQVNAAKTAVDRKNVRVRTNGGTQMVNFTVAPLETSSTAAELMMIVFEETSAAGPPAPADKRRTAGTKAEDRIQALEQELQDSREDLQSTIEELETANEELKSTNEELQSTNEELQSTNEELETTKEEQQSLNEELVTVNTELQSKIDELTDANNDMKNLLDSVDIPTIFLDMDLCIRRFTSHATRVVNLIAGDIGRPIDDIATRLQDVSLTEIAGDVLKDLVFREKEVQSKDGLFYSVRITPYRTLDNVIDGVVITFIDITQNKKLEVERRLATVVIDSNDAVTVQDFNGNIRAWNRGAEKMYGYSEAEALKMNISRIIPPDESKKAVNMVRRIKAGEEVKAIRTKRKAKNGKILEVWLTVTKLVDNQGKPSEIATTERDLAWLTQT